MSCRKVAKQTFLGSLHHIGKHSITDHNNAHMKLILAHTRRHSYQTSNSTDGLKNNQIGVLDPSSESTALEAGASLELPYWLVQALFMEESTQLDLPKPYTHSYRDILIADANVVDLHRLCKYFYEFGKLVSELIETRGALQLCSTLIQGFIERFRLVSDWAQNASDCEQGLSDKLDNYEKALLSRGKVAHEKLASWLSYGVPLITTARLVDKYKKRKQVASSLLLSVS